MNFDQLIENEKHFFFFKNHMQNLVQKPVPEPFIKKQN